MFDGQDRPHIKKGQIKYTKGYRTKRFFSKSINLIIILAMISIASLAVFVFIKQPVKTNDGYISAKPIYETISHGEKVLVIEGSDTGLFAPLKRAMFPQEYYYAKVVAGPYGEIKLTSGAQSIDDGSSVVGVNLGDIEFEEGEAFLDNKYVVRKIDEFNEDIDGEIDRIVEKEEILGALILNH